MIHFVYLYEILSNMEKNDKKKNAGLNDVKQQKKTAFT